MRAQWSAAFLLLLLIPASPARGEDPPLTTEQQANLTRNLDARIAALTKQIAADPKAVALYSQCGDALFFRGRFQDAVADYEKMVELDPTLETSHWRRGIAFFYAGRYKDAARQFEIYSTFDDVDRENGIWRYLSQRKAYGRDKAREGLLKYEKDDREPFPSVYKLFSGETTPEKILTAIRTADITAGEREKRLFYAHLYIGLNHAVEDRPKEARSHLREAVANTWGPKAGGGPTWMWHVGRLHYDLLSERQAAADHPSPRPNVLFLFSDDQRFDTIAALGNDEIATPNLDRLVGRGTAFTHAFCMGSTHPAVCLPSRAMLMSGRSLFRTPTDLKGTVTLPEAFREAGYDTFGTGKWHNGPASYARSFSHGDAVFFGGMHAHESVPVSPFDPSGRYPKELRKSAGVFSSELFADAAIRFLEDRDADRPFFAFVSFTAPHDPRTPPGKYATMYDPAQIRLPENFLPQHPFDNGELTIRDERLAPWPRTPEEIRRHIADYYGIITHLDHQIGRILAALDRSEQADHTIVVFSSDHGLAVGQHGLLGKQSLYDHSMRSPLIFAGPGIPQGKKSDALCYLFDIAPTLCHLADVPVPAGMEGKSLAPILAGRNETDGRDALFLAYRDVQRAIRTDRWKLIRYPQINRTQLFDLAADPHECRDLSAVPEHAERVAAMMIRLADLQRRFDDIVPLTSTSPQPAEIDLK